MADTDCAMCGHASHEPLCCRHQQQSGGANGMIQVCACGRGMIGDPDWRYRQRKEQG